jgi:hypothetical protein
MASKKELEAAIKAAESELIAAEAARGEVAKRHRAACDALFEAKLALARSTLPVGWVVVPADIEEDLAKLAEAEARKMRQIVSDTARDSFASRREESVVLGMYSARIEHLSEFAEKLRKKKP